MGLAALMPGLSSATIAALTGIYPRLMTALARPRLADWRLWCPLIMGMGSAVILGARLLVWALSYSVTRVGLRGLLAALVLWAVIVCGRAARPWTWLSIGVAIAGLCLGLFSFLFLPVMGERVWEIAATGVLASWAVLLPGLSGAAVVHALGAYERMVRAFAQWDWAFLAALLLGLALGVVLFAKVLHRLHNRAPTLTMAFFTGCMVGAWPHMG